MKLFNLNQSKILTINSDFLKNSRNALLLFLLSHFAIIGFFFFKEHALLFSDDNADSSFEKGKTDPQQVLLAKITMNQRKGQGMMNGAPRCKLWVICPHGGSQPWGASRECHTDTQGARCHLALSLSAVYLLLVFYSFEQFCAQKWVYGTISHL